MSPKQDYSAGDGVVCPLLTHLVGPGGPFLDLQLVVSPNDYAHTFRLGTSHSRCDLALGNRAALGLISRAYVESDIGVGDGGHSPVVVELRDHSTWALNWKCPRPRLPPLLTHSSSELRALPEWTELVEQWQGSAAVQDLLALPRCETAQAVSKLLD